MRISARRFGDRSRLDRSVRGLAAAAFGALALSACQAERSGPTGHRITERRETPFELRLRTDHIDEAQCAVRLTASAWGGPENAYAAWGDLEGRSYDFETHELVRSRTHALYPHVFEAPTIATGHM